MTTRNRIVALAAFLLACAPDARLHAAEPAEAAAKASEAALPRDSARSTADADFDQFENSVLPQMPSGQPVKAQRDPLKYYNRAMYHVNDKFYFWIAKPLARVYGFIVPTPVRVGVNNAYYNLFFPVRLVSSALQGKMTRAGEETGRFLINTTLGVGGLFNPAERWIRKPPEEDLGQTFGKWGIGTGFPLVLPLLGQNNLRDTIGLAPTFLLNPVYYAANYPTYMGVTAGKHFNNLSLHIGQYESIKKEALDPYTFIRDAHLQNRATQIKE